MSTPKPMSSRSRLTFDAMPAAVYAVGDIHGCLSELRALEKRIYEDAETVEGEKWIIYLGDLIDRGPSSAQVIDHVLSKPKAGIRKFGLAGNHEVAFLQYVDSGCRYKEWLSFGGVETLVSYGLYAAANGGSVSLQSIKSHVPDEHLDFFRELPIMIKAGNYCFVHAGIDPSQPLEKQIDDVLLWSRPSQFDWTIDVGPLKIIHGHTPVEKVEFSGPRVNVDIGAFARGPLAAISIKNDQINVILSR